MSVELISVLVAVLAVGSDLGWVRMPEGLRGK